MLCSIGPKLVICTFIDVLFE